MIKLFGFVREFSVLLVSKFKFIFFLNFGLYLLLSSCTHTTTSVSDKQTHANATLVAKSNYKNLKGHVHIMYKNETLTLTAKVEGLKPNSLHGFHIHEIGDCSAADASSAGGHFSPNPKNKHGSHTDPDRHAGDLGNLKSDSKGVAEVSVSLYGLNLQEKDKSFSVLNRAVIIHEMADDFTTQPTGNSGARIGCGVINK